MTEAKAKPKRKKPEAGQHLRDLGIQRYTLEAVHRSKLVGADYNPRVISDRARQRLRKILAKRGLVSAPTWNRRTGNLVAGHKRVELLDALAGTPDYTLDVCVIDVPEVEERELNIALNNPEAQGEYEMDKLGELFAPGTMDVEATGFSAGDVATFFGEEVVANQSPEALAALAENLRIVRGRQEEHLGKLKAQRDHPEFYQVIVFKSAEDRVAFTDKYGLPDQRYQKASVLIDAIIRKARGEAE